MTALSRTKQLIGKPVLRLEDPALLRGRALEEAECSTAPRAH
jgi:hypothetical protein